MTVKTNEELFEELDRLYASFDPNYMYSDDHGVWSRNKAKWNQICRLRNKLEKIDEKRVNEICDKHKW